MQKERNWLIQEFQKYALDMRSRVSFVSGDVHCAAVGVFRTFVKGKKKPGVPPTLDHRYMVNVVSSMCLLTSPLSNPLKCIALLRCYRQHAVSTDNSAMRVVLNANP